MIVKLVATDAILAFTSPPVINKSLSSGGSTLQIDVGSTFSATNSSGTCFTINDASQAGYPFNSLALPFEVVAETQLGVRLFRGFFDEYTTKYSKDNTTSSLTFRDCSRFLERSPLVGTYRNTFMFVLLTLIEQCEPPVAQIFLPVIANTGTTKALQCIKRINFVAPPIAGDILIVGQKRYKYVVEAPTTDLELNIETNLATMATELVGKLNATSASECTAELQGNNVVITGILYNNNLLVYTDGTRITNEILQDASASDETGTVISIWDLHVNLVLEGETLRGALEKLCPLAQCQFYVDVPHGNLVIYQPSYLQDTITRLRTLDASDGSLLCLDTQGIIENLSYKDDGNAVNRVIVWGKNGEISLPELRLEDQHITVTKTNTIKHDIIMNSEVLDYGWDTTADRVLQVKITPKMVEPVEGTCYSVPIKIVHSDFDTTNADVNTFSANTLNLSTTATVEIEQAAQFSLTLTDIPTDERALPNYIKLIGIVVFDSFLETFESYEAEVDFYLYDPDENILLEKINTEIVRSNARFTAEIIAPLNDYKGDTITIKGVTRVVPNFTALVSFYIFGSVHCVRCDDIPVYLQDTVGDSFVSSITLGDPFTSNEFLSLTFADIQSTELNFPSQDTENTFKIDLRDPVYYSGMPYIQLTEILDTTLGFGTVNAETTLYINSTEIFHRQTTTIDTAPITYNSNISLEAYIDEEIELLIIQSASTQSDLPARSLVTVQAAGTVICVYPESGCPNAIIVLETATGETSHNIDNNIFNISASCSAAGDGMAGNGESGCNVNLDSVFSIDLTNPDYMGKTLSLTLGTFVESRDFVFTLFNFTYDYFVSSVVDITTSDGTVNIETETETVHVVTTGGVAVPSRESASISGSYEIDLTPYAGEVITIHAEFLATVEDTATIQFGPFIGRPIGNGRCQASLIGTLNCE